jgi:hypothetical protein
MTAFSLDDVRTIEEDEDASPFEVSAAIQRAINSGMWSLQGSYGRTMMHAIEAGQCMLGERDARDYYGNHIPSRTQVQAGTKGSYEFVVDRMGEAWADKMKAV